MGGTDKAMEATFLGTDMEPYDVDGGLMQKGISGALNKVRESNDQEDKLQKLISLVAVWSDGNPDKPAEQLVEDAGPELLELIEELKDPEFPLWLQSIIYEANGFGKEEPEEEEFIDNA